MDWKEPLLRPLARTAVGLFSRTRLPKTRGSVKIKGLRGQVEILRDRWYVPHIFADDTADVLFAQGYLHAQERLWQMDFNRRVVTGRLSEIFGSVTLDNDRVFRTLGLHHVAKREAEETPEPLKSFMRAYCAGANTWIETAIRRRKLPVEFTLLGFEPEPWKPENITGWAKLMSWTLAGNWHSEFLRGQMIQKLGAEKVAALELDTCETWAVVLDAAGLPGERRPTDPTRPYKWGDIGEGAGSNNWVVHGDRTATGKPLLANDMHLDLTTPSIWFENHLCSSEVNVTGVSFPGAPFVISGHNGRVAWGFTDGLPDVQDLYEERLRERADGKPEYEYAGKWHPAHVRQEHIKVKGASTEVMDVVSTRHGPIVNILFEKTFPDAPAMSMRWTALEPETSFQAFYHMNLAQDCEGLHQALRLFDGPPQNVVYADTAGSIGYTLNGKIPIRSKGDGSVPAPGWTGEYEWKGYIPFEELPHLINPPAGFVATANNPQMREVTRHYLGSDYCQADRAARITELLEEQPRVDIPYIQKMHYDVISISGRVMAKYLGGLQVEDADLQAVVRAMQAWDGSLTADSAMAAVYQVTVRKALGLVYDAHLGEFAGYARGKDSFSWLWSQHSWEWFIRLLEQPDSPWFNLGSGEQRDDVLAKALRQGVDYLKKKLGPNEQDWAWGKLHQLTFRHILGAVKPMDAAFNLGPLPVGGDGSTISSTATSYYDLSHQTVTGPAFRFIADLGDLDHCLGVLAPGQSGHPASRHFRDGIEPWMTGQYHTMLYRREEIEQQAKARLVMKPI